MDCTRLICDACKGATRPYGWIEQGVWTCYSCNEALDNNYTEKVHHFYNCPEKENAYFCMCTSLAHDKNKHYKLDQ